MIERLRERYAVRAPNVLEAMRRVPRHFFVTEALRGRSYDDNALPIDFNQTISQPFIVARMTELLELDKKSRVLEIGAGSGYQTAVLAQLASQLYAIERIGRLPRQARTRLRDLRLYHARGNALDRTPRSTSHCRSFLPERQQSRDLAFSIGPSASTRMVGRIIETLCD